MITPQKTSNSERIAREKVLLREQIKFQENILLADIEKLPGMVIASGVNAGKSTFKGNIFQTASHLFGNIKKSSSGNLPTVLKDTAQQVAVMAAMSLISYVFKKKLL